MFILKYIIFISFLLISYSFCTAGNDILADNQSSIPRERLDLLQEAKVQAARKDIEITVRNVEITRFPEIRIIIEAYNRLGEPLDALTADNLFVYENDVPKKVLSVEKIPTTEIASVDFIFAIDITGTMQSFMNQVKENLTNFTSRLFKRGIDYRLGLILFDDDINRVYKFTKNTFEFLKWLEPIRAFGGSDEKENALEALNAATKFDFRPEATRVVVLITDAPYHQSGENGQGTTNFTTESIIDKLIQNEIRVFSIVPPKLVNYHVISRKTRGNYFDIDFPFSTILDNFSKQLTNLFILTYRSDQSVIPDSIEIALFNPDQSRLVRKVIPIVELGRKLIIENLLFQTNRFELPPNVDELNILADFMISKENISILIEGHTDSIGSDALNDNLSLQRAESVKKYLISKGVDAARMTSHGFGKRKPIASNRDEFGRQLNRRTEIIIVSK